MGTDVFCGPNYKAAYGLGVGRVSTFEDPDLNMIVTLVEQIGDGFRVRIEVGPQA